MSINRNLLNIIIILCICLNLGCNDGAQERETDSHTIQVSSLLPSSSSSCVLSPRGDDFLANSFSDMIHCLLAL